MLTIKLQMEQMWSSTICIVLISVRVSIDIKSRVAPYALLLFASWSEERFKFRFRLHENVVKY